MKSILKDLKLQPLIPKFAAKRIEPEKVSELSDDELVRLGVTNGEIASAPFVLTPKKNISLWLQQLFANAWLFSADVVAAAEGVDVLRNEKFLRRELDSNFGLFSQPPSTENSVVDRKASAWARHNGSVNSKRAHSPGICWAFQFNSIQFYLHFYKIFTLYIYLDF